MRKWSPRKPEFKPLLTTNTKRHPFHRAPGHSPDLLVAGPSVTVGQHICLSASPSTEVLANLASFLGIPLDRPSSLPLSLSALTTFCPEEENIFLPPGWLRDVTTVFLLSSTLPLRESLPFFLIPVSPSLGPYLRLTSTSWCLLGTL